MLYKKRSQLINPNALIGFKVVNGHHRYISSLLANVEIEIVDDYPEPSSMNDLTWSNVILTQFVH